MEIEFNGDERAERLKCKIEEFLANHDKQGRRIRHRKSKVKRNEKINGC